MKLTSEEIFKITKHIRDWEGYHHAYDDLLEQKIRELDPELADDFATLKDNGTFWYA